VDLRGGVVGEAELVVAVGPGRIVEEGLEPTGRIVAISGGGGPAARGGAAGGAEVEGGDRIPAVLADPPRPVEPVMLVGEVGAVGMSDPDPAS
jgi:hypothetical protein